MDTLSRRPPQEALPSREEGPDLEKRLKDFFTAHHGEPGWDVSEHALGWMPRDYKPALTYVENACVMMRANGSPELYEARRLINEIDAIIRSESSIKPTPEETLTILMNLAGDELRIKRGSATGRELAEAEDEYREWLNDIDLYKNGAGIELVLDRVEDRIYLANKSIDIESGNDKPNKKLIDADRARLKVMRRARAQLLNEYFTPRSTH